MRTPAIALSLLLVVVTLAGALVISRAPSYAVGSVSAVRVDTNVSGNTATSAGVADPCTGIAPNGTLIIDVLVYSDVVANTPGIAGFNFMLNYNTNIVKVVDHVYQTMFLFSGVGSGTPIDFSDPVPDTDGTFAVGIADFGNHDEGGGGVLSRITLEAVGSGTSPLLLSSVAVVGGDAEELPVASVVDGTIVVGGSCPGPSPTPGPTIPPTFAPSPTPSPLQTPTPTQPSTATPTPSAAPSGTPQASSSPTPVGQTPTPALSPTPTTPLGPTVTPAPSEPVTMKGDADCSSDVTTYDAVFILLSLGVGQPIPCPSAADVNCDGHITTADLQTLLKWRGGLAVTPPVGCPAIAAS